MVISTREKCRWEVRRTVSISTCSHLRMPPKVCPDRYLFTSHDAWFVHQPPLGVKLPVMFWIFGGYFQQGNNAWWAYGANSSYYIIPTVLFSLMFNAPRFFELSTQTLVCDEQMVEKYNCTENATKIQVTATDFRKDISYREIYIIYLNFVVNGLLPFVALLAMNISVYRNLNQFR